ncbi:heparinase II/III family protein [Halogeometricum sp. S1BR25-6]|uniref:Heparinase II/III family protein n=1 Tax=Halogeometricum salsisoli TaxID=2950536 RepID=A0ABU2GFW3_9EURY|nr:alginate lyase family protein [Halogeometricum sp. S1BR25-6]MDS0299660.1 heparinase II/III family protein [Halogeometricum sp. S1BR25-6]
MSGDGSSSRRFADVRTLSLLFRTVSNMKPRQLAGVADRKLRHAVVPALPVDFDARYDRRVPDDLSCTPGPLRANTTVLRRSLSGADRSAFRARAAEATDGEATFLDRTIRVEGPDGVGWHDEAVYEPPALWALKFHGFEFLRGAYLGHDDPTDCPAATETFPRWLADWQADESTNIGTEAYLRRAWTPHSVSFRLLNAARYYAWLGADERHPALAARLQRLLYRNASFLSNHVEHDIGGNHLIENGIALVVAGLLVDDAGDPWVDAGVEVLVDAADQFLADGGHFELSPMYHVLTLTRYLTALDLLRRYGRTPPSEIRAAAERGTAFLRAIAPPDRRLPLLNDSVHGESLSLRACLRYASAVGVDPGPSATTAMPDSGYYWLGRGDDALLVDAGGIGPPHLPAHSHNDQFSVLLWVDGRSVLTDTGTYEYAPTDRRQHTRSVAAHNTVQYGDVEPIDIAGSYLMGRRFDPRVRHGVVDGVTAFDGAYRRVGNDAYAHRRRIYAADDWWLVWDRVTADEARPVRSRLHVDPDVAVDGAADTGAAGLGFRTDGDADPLAYLYSLEAAETTVGTSPYFPSFLTEVERPSVTLRSSGADVSFGFLLSKRPYETVALERDGADPRALSLDGTDRSLPDLDRLS